MSTHAFPMGGGMSRGSWWMWQEGEDRRGERRGRGPGPGRRGRGPGSGRRGGHGEHGGFGGFGGFGPEGPRGFGPGAHRPPFGRPGRGRRGDVRAAILALLNEGPRNGYQLITDISARTDELWKPSPGSVYPALSALEDEGLIEPVELDGKKVFQLSDAGRAYVAEHADELTDPWDAVSKPWAGMLRSRKAMMQIGMALQQVALTGDPELAAGARRILDDTVRSLYRLLADQGNADPVDGETSADSEGDDEQDSRG